MDKVLLDTDILSEITKRKNWKVIQKSDQYYQEHKRWTTSIFTVIEVLKGFYKKEMIEKANKFLLSIPTWEVLNLDLDSAHVASKIYADLERTGQPIGRCDPMIASIAIRNNLILVTGNKDHYERIKKLGYPLRAYPKNIIFCNSHPKI